MNFFKAQDQARKSTVRLVILFSLAIICLIFITNLFVVLMSNFDLFMNTNKNGYQDGSWFNLETFIWVSIAVCGIILLSSGIKFLQLAEGGRVVAESLGGKLIPQNSDEPTHQKILNVVEEMALASGSHVPMVYLIEQPSINAFAAGWNSSDAVIGITRGAVEKLTRNELQGVIAHEFSHILNGDMRLNIQLTGAISGIEIISAIGRSILHFLSHAGSRRHNNDRNTGGIPALLLFAVGLVIIGYIGLFFGNLIKAAISRHREYLADASAVQFTRNPQSIANALKKIGGDSYGSILDSTHVEEYSHLYFSKGFTQRWFSGFDTHPPLDERIERIEPSWDGQYIFPPKPQAAPQADQEPPLSQAQKAAIAAGIAVGVLEGRDAIDGIGKSAGEKEIAYASTLLEEMPEQLHSELKDPYGVRAVIYAILLDSDEEIKTKQLFHLNQHAADGVYEKVSVLRQYTAELSDRFRLPVIDMAIPTLRELSLEQYKLFRANALVLMKADKQIDLKEWLLQRLLFRHLDEAFGLSKRPAARHAFIGAVKHPWEVMMSMIAYLEHKSEIEAEQAFVTGKTAIKAGALKIVPKDQITTDILSQSMDELEMLKPLLKERFLKSCAITLTHNGKVTVMGAELLRALASGLDSPMPPILSTEHSWQH